MRPPDHRAETTIRFAVREQITGAADRSTTARPQARSASPPRPDVPSGTHTPNNVTASAERSFPPFFHPGMAV